MEEGMKPVVMENYEFEYRNYLYLKKTWPSGLVRAETPGTKSMLLRPVKK